MGQPIRWSVKAGFKAGPAIENFSPFPKLTRSRCEDGNGAGVQPEAIRMSQNSVQAGAAFLIHLVEIVLEAQSLGSHLDERSVAAALVGWRGPE